MSEVKYVVYKRLSKENKNKAQYGMDSQQMDIDFFLESQKDYEIIGEFSEFVSGTSDNKVELEKALQLCRDTGACLLISKLDRLSRSLSQVALLLESKIEIKVSVMPSANNFMLGIFACLAAEEVASIRLRVKRGLEAAKKRGVKIGGSSPKHKATYQANKAKGLHKRPQFIQSSRDAAQPIVKEITNIIKYSKGNVTQAQICEHLNSAGLKTPRGGEFTPPTVSRMIKKYKIDYSNKTKYDELGV